MSRSLLLAPALIAGALLSSVPTPSAAAAGEDGWRFMLTPYLWAATIDGSAGAGDVDLPDLNPDYSFFSLENLDMAAFVAFEARRGRWGLLSDALYVSFGDRFTAGPLTTGFGISGGAFEVSGLYAPTSLEHVEFVFGVRTVSLKLDLEITPGGVAKQTETWTDPIAGLRMAYPLGGKWRFLARADAGGLGVGSDLTVNAMLGAGRDIGERSSLIFGYRYLSFDFEDDGYAVDLSVSGYLAAWQYRF